MFSTGSVVWNCMPGLLQQHTDFSCYMFSSLENPKLWLVFLHFHPSISLHVCLCAHINAVVSLLTSSVTSWRPSLGCLLLIQPVSVCSPTQFAIKTKFRALKPEGKWVSAQGRCCLATRGDGVKRVYLRGRGVGGGGVCKSVCVLCVGAGHMLVFSDTCRLSVIGHQTSHFP